MVEPVAAARHALALEAMELSRAVRRGADRMGRTAGPTRRTTIRHAAKPLCGNACNSGGLIPAMLAPNAEPTTWEEY